MKKSLNDLASLTLICCEQLHLTPDKVSREPSTGQSSSEPGTIISMLFDLIQFYLCSLSWGLSEKENMDHLCLPRLRPALAAEKTVWAALGQLTVHSHELEEFRWALWARRGTV